MVAGAELVVVRLGGLVICWTLYVLSRAPFPCDKLPMADADNAGAAERVICGVDGVGRRVAEALRFWGVGPNHLSELTKGA